jgi:predicted nucleotide-binding protein
VKPRDLGERVRGLVQAALRPELFRKIYERYDNGMLPQGQFFRNVLEKDFGVAPENSGEVAEFVAKNGTFAKIVRDIKGSPGVLLEPERAVAEEAELAKAPEVAARPTEEKIPPAPTVEEIRVFIGHGKNKGIVEQVKTMLEFGNYKYEVAEETETTAIPVPQKIMESMRRCKAGIISISADEQEKQENGRYAVNKNVLIEIGAAFVLYDRKVVLVIDRRVDLPSNLQGLYKCEYEGNELSWEAGVKLQRAVTEFRTAAASGK